MHPAHPLGHLLRCLALALLLSARPTFGHDALASFADLWLGPQTMELTITMARSAAFLLIKDQHPDAAYVDADTFAKVRAPLLVAGANLCRLTAASKALTPNSIDVEMTDENDVQFRLVYPRPTERASVRFEFPYLKKMVEGHLLTRAVWNEDKTGLNTRELRADENQAVDVVLPAPKVIVR